MPKLPKRPDGSALTADELLQIDLKNILKKLTAGKPLTAGERKIIEAAGYETEAAIATPDRNLPKRANDKNMRLIIERETNISDRKAYGWLRKLRDQYYAKSTGWRVKEALEEIEARQNKSRGPDVDLRREKLSLECDILRHRRDLERGDLVEKKEYEDAIRAVFQAAIYTIDIAIKTMAAEAGDVGTKRKLEDARRRAYGAVQAEAEERLGDSVQVSDATDA